MKAVILNKNDIKTIILLGSSIKKRYKYKFLKKTVGCINIGPTLNENIFYTSTCRMLANFGYEHKTVNRSKIPLRY